MLKKILTKKLLVTTAAFFALFLIYIIPKSETQDFTDKIPQKLEYVKENITTDVVYLLDSYDFLARAEVVVNSNRTIEQKAKELMEILIKGGAGESKIPNGFKSILPSDTRILSLKYENNLIKINLSKELLDINEELEEKMIEAIIYTLTSIEEVHNIILYVDGDILTKLPKSKVNLPSTLNRQFGINKKYDIETYKDINQVTIYYLNKYNDNFYYVPVTKYVNDSRDKIEIIIDELSSSHVYNSNLMSFLSNNTKLLSVEKNDDLMHLKFNNYIFSDNINEQILEEVIYTICLSIKDNYDVDEVIFDVENKEITKKVLKTIE
ncbi:MAG: GerMN domain-containing protein [Bacilli bacterium]|nr:GerMN domain-containing protein [Bacilli bacterium]MDD4547584.1 GerMN domain-containing protein [Bacilli bacterium]